MSNLGHLIENTLIFMEQNPQATYDDIIAFIKKDVNYLNNYIDARDICEICLYVRYSYMRSILSEINSEIRNMTGYARTVKLSDLKKILSKYMPVYE